MSDCSVNAWKVPAEREPGVLYDHGQPNYDYLQARAIVVGGVRFERVRECHNKARYGNFKCDKCNAFLQLTDFDEEPMLTVNGVAYVPDYCPHCGAKAVSADD